jgi:hypothetical protein
VLLLHALFLSPWAGTYRLPSTLWLSKSLILL